MKVERLMKIIKILNSREVENTQRRYSVKIIARRLARRMLRLSAMYSLNFIAIWQGCSLGPF